MPTRVYLVRHATHDLVGRVLAGRMKAVTLSEAGRAESDALARRLGALPIAALYSSPLERALETAAPLAARANLEVTVAEALNEFDFGAWTGREIASLAGEPLWMAFNTQRSRTRAPGGESMMDVQARMVRFLEDLHARHPDGTVVLVSHGDVLRAALLHYLGMSLDSFMRIELDPASVSILELAAWGPRLLALNSGLTTPAA